MRLLFFVVERAESIAAGAGSGGIPNLTSQMANLNSEI
jgi:hypothetical protein